MLNARLFIGSAYPGITRVELQDDGAWQADSLLRDYDVRCLASDPNAPGTIFAGTQGSGLLRSDDWGVTWQPSGLDGMVVKSLAISAAKVGLMAAGTKPPLVYTSQDGGMNWRESESFRLIPSRPFWRSPAEKPGTAYVQSLAISPTNPDIIVAGIEFGAVVRSTDGGRTWQGHREGSLRDCHTLISHVSDGRYMYEAGGTGAGVSVSRTSGETWEQPRGGLDRHYGWAVAADPGDPGICYVSAAPGPRRAHSETASAEAAIFRASQGGWQKLSGGLPEPLESMPYALLTDPNEPGHIYAGLRNGEIWASENYGDAWEQLPLHLGRIDGALIMVT